jgi:hypothetical protein
MEQDKWLKILLEKGGFDHRRAEFFLNKKVVKINLLKLHEKILPIIIFRDLYEALYRLRYP